MQRMMVRARRAKGLSRKKLAELLDVPVERLAEWETGASRPCAYETTALQRALDLPPGAWDNALADACQAALQGDERGGYVVDDR